MSDAIISIVLLLPLLIGFLCYKIKSKVLWATSLLAFGLFSIPISISQFEYSNWILRFGTNVCLLITIALGVVLIAKVIDLNSKKIVVIVFGVAAFLNVVNQGFTLFAKAFGNGDYPSQHSPNGDWKIDNYHIYSWWHQGFAGPEYHQYAVEETALNGHIYKELTRTTENDTLVCIIKFNNGMVFDKCKGEFTEIPKSNSK